MLLGPGHDRIVNLLDSGQNRLFVADQEFMCLQVGDIDFCIERAEIKQSYENRVVASDGRILGERQGFNWLG